MVGSPVAVGLALLPQLALLIARAVATADDRVATVLCPSPADCTVVLQRALSDPALQHVVVPSGVWSTLPLVLNRSDVVLTLEAGAVIQARRGFFHGLYDSLLTVCAHHLAFPVTSH